jgi:CO/xanthine dehydrogenase Mo-binding subunit
MIASAMDLPETKVFLFESDDPAGTYGAKSIGEPATEGVAAAIISAVRNATGLRIRRIPINQVKLLEMLKGEGGGNADGSSTAGGGETGEKGGSAV